MPIWVSILVVVLVLGIIFLSGGSPTKSKTREEYIDELCRYLEGQKKVLSGDVQGYQIAFNFEGRDFIFEDVEREGFNEKVHKAYLKTKTKSALTVNFTEGSRITIRSTMVKASDITDTQIERLNVPKELKKFQISTNYIEKTNALFDEPKILQLFVHYFNTGGRGEPAMGIRIQDGWITLEFFEFVHMRPNLFDLMQTPAKIEAELFRLITLANAIEAKPDNP